MKRRETSPELSRVLDFLVSRAPLLGSSPAREPLQYASGYSLDLYCDHQNGRHGWQEFPHTFTGETFGECARLARDVGWKIHRKTRTATCPKCSGFGQR